VCGLSASSSRRRSDLGADIQMLHMPEGGVTEVGKTLESLLG